ncbi:SAM-dependent methyltransferase [Corynebacterium sp. 13CS0277]|uniref:SAM-dependent methyltransferase n=1 Tax=Corynebacterium sp. 13CS0277 TaxID=2071994 RepID=UPI000D023961|nr:SAM-dependent methyltransferase [Corynebacterium sp. 13CS0277]PRQ12206.1 SAM-dependent methyltransferase [Corynebacterium sp. 13CS0277]
MADHAHNLRASFRVPAGTPVGVITRGTTNTNRLRRCDRWMLHSDAIRRALVAGGTHPQAIDVGYGASHTTTCEWARHLRRIAAGVDVLGLEIDPARVLPPRDGVRFGLGGFELAGNHPQLVRAFNVLRQYDAAQVADAWATVCERLAPGGLFVEGTCDELGRHISWVLLDATGPQSLTLAWSPWHTQRPSQLAERLPKALIHRNTPGEQIHDLLRAMDDAWDRAAGFAPFGPRARWFEARRLLQEAGVPLVPQRRLLRDCLLTVPWELVA